MAKILIQENDSAVLDVLTQALQSEGHQPIPILDNCPLAMGNYIKHYLPALVLMDYRSNSNTGTLLLAAIRKLSSKMPVIALSCDFNIAKTALKVGFSDVLEKPFDLDNLFAKVQRCLSGPSPIPCSTA